MTSLIITAAGKASRFHDVGYDMPKYLLPWINSKSILKNIIDELTFSNLIDYILVIVNKREQFFEETIRNELPSGINSELLFVRDTLGQAHTTLLGVEEIIKKGLGDDYFIMHNSDTILKNRDIKKLISFSKNKKIIGFVDTFQSNNKAYSYILESGGILKRFLEKETISPMASSGLISFSSANKFLEIYNNYSDEIDNKSEIYMSKFIDCSSQRGDLYKVNYNPNTANTIVLGTPEEYCLAYTINSSGIKGI